MNRHPHKPRPLTYALCLALALFTTDTFAKENFDHWRQSRAESEVRVDHTLWNKFLKRYVTVSADGLNRVAYKSVAPEDLTRLNSYIHMLEKIKVTQLAKPEQMAYWINLYNAVTVRVILDHYPLKSIRDISFGLLGALQPGPWGEKLTRAEGMELTLDNIEHQILRPIFGDTRVHYALNCASVGCPNLQPRAFTRDDLEIMLESAAREYINNSRGVRFDGDKLIASSLLTWYAEDFGANQLEILAHLMKYAEPKLRRRLLQVERIDDYAYDWSLNE